MSDERHACGSSTRNILVENSDISIDRRKFMAMTSGLATTAMAGCFGGSADGESGTLRVAAPSTVSAMDPHWTQTGWDYTVLLNIAQPLFELDPDLNIRGVLAEDLTMSDDGLTWDLKLREGVQFHPPHDRELVAEDVVKNFDRIQSEGVSYPKNTIKHVSSWSANGDYELQLEFDEPSSSTQSWMAASGGCQILAPEAFEDADEAITNPIGTGPFKFEEWQEQDHITLSAFGDYWEDDLPHLDQVIFRYIPEPSAMITELLSGNPGVDIVWTPPAAQLETLKQNNNVQVPSQPGTHFNSISLNCSGSANSGRGSEAPTAYREIRQAVNYAANQEAMIEVAVRGNGVATETYFTENNPWYHDYEMYGLGADPDQARNLIAESPLSEPVDITVIAPSADDGHRGDVGPVLQQNLNEAGFNVTYDEIEFSEWITRFTQGQFDVTPNSYQTTIHPDFLRTNIDEDYGDWLSYQSGPNTNSDQVFELFAEGNALFDQQEAKDVYDELQELLIEDGALLPYMIPDTIRAHRKSVNNYTIHPSNGFMIEDVTLD